MFLILKQVREATADFCDVWLNIAHILVEQKQFIRAIQMYENCAKKFYKHTSTELLLYLARALFKANRLAECRQMLLKARHVAPEDTLLMFNSALIQQKLSKQVLQDNKSNLRQVESAVSDLKSAHRTFTWLATETDRPRIDFKCDLKGEAKLCQDLLNQAAYHLARAKKIDEEEKELKRKQEMQIMELKKKQLDEIRMKEQEKELQKQALKEKRDEFMKMKTQTMNMMAETEKKTSKKVILKFLILVNIIY